MEQSVSAHFLRYLQCSPLAESSQAVKKRAFKYFLRFCGDPPIERVTYEHGEDFRNGIVQALVADGRDPDKARITANIYLKNLKPFFSWAQRRRILPIHIWSEVKEFPVGIRHIRPYTPEEIARMLMVADGRWKVIILLALMSMRRAEILNLVVRDIHFDKNMILISPKKDTEYTWRWSIKNHNQAYVPLCPAIETADGVIELHRLLIELIEWLPVKQPYVLIKPDLYQHLLAQKRAGILTWERRNNPWGNFSRDFRQLLKRAAVEPRRFHDLRGTFATKMGERLPLRKIQQLMRHASPQTTVTYIHLDEQALVAESAEILKKCYA